MVPRFQIQLLGCQARLQCAFGSSKRQQRSESDRIPTAESERMEANGSPSSAQLSLHPTDAHSPLREIAVFWSYVMESPIRVNRGGTPTATGNSKFF